MTAKIRAGFFTVPILLLVAQLAAQQAPAEPLTASAILQLMNSSKMEEREKAFDEAAKLLASTTSPRNVQRLRLGVIELLSAENARNNISDMEAAKLGDEENAKIAARCKNDNNCVNDDDEEEDDPDTDYMHKLIATVAGFNDERAIPALAGAVGWDDNVTRALLAFGDKALAPVIDQLKGRNSFRRISALDMAIALLEIHRDASSQTRIMELIRSSLNDPWPLVRTHVVREIDCRQNRQDFAPLLQEVAKTDPFILPQDGPADDGGDGGKFYPVRADARRVLRHIQSHEPCTP
ncbi:MAG TPA: hypothetical protein VMD99_03765 [Terriglobales bacterium]|nr:hypothetical protein [Terriglobales bacterium]